MIMPIAKEPRLSFEYPHPFSKVYRFKVTLKEVAPPVWRRIEIPETYSFWGLHVAITDAFGWFDYHLHEFNILDSRTGKTERLGVWDQGDPDVKMDWKFSISPYFSKRENTEAIHRYDFGDGWEHLIELEGLYPRDAGATYPRCLEGKGTAPPEDCGGPEGYEDLLKIIDDPTHKEYGHKADWLRSMKGTDFDPGHFDPEEVRFDNPDKRWAVVFNRAELTPDLRMWGFFKDRQGCDFNLA